MKNANVTDRNTPPCGKEKTPKSNTAIKDRSSVTPTFVLHTEGIDTRTVLKWAASAAIVLGGYAAKEILASKKKGR